MGKDPLEVKIAKALKKKNKTLALAESCTGGLISSRITDVPGSSDYFLGGIIAYSNDVKVSELGVHPGVLKAHGAVSREVVRAMAKNVRWLLNADVAAAVTGIAGPTGGSAKKPVGLAYIAFSSGRISKTKKVLFKGSRAELKKKFAETMLALIAENI